MNRKIYLAVAAGFAAGLLVSSCGGGTRDLCTEKNVTCDSPLTCDSTDGLCKCGGRGGLVCGEGFACDAVSNTCLSKKCAGVDCSNKPGTSCDVVDGMCKCGGTGGVVCTANQVCNPNAKSCALATDCNQTACPRNQTCDSSSGQCRCGAATCAAADFCSPIGSDGGTGKSCVANLCAGVKCSGATTCDPADGYCKCNGTLCQSGQACACPAGGDGGACQDPQRVCRAGGACDGVTCGGSTTCDPADGQCKCGGPGGPTCASNQICSMSSAVLVDGGPGVSAQCQGGAQCSNPDGGSKVCSGGTSCDPEDGKCKCGGRAGQVCLPGTAVDPAEVCISNPAQKACRRPCDITKPDCPTGTGCYFDSSAATPAAYCAAPTEMKDIDQACATATSCFGGGTPGKALHCNALALGQPGLCRAYCDTSVGPAGCLQVPMAQTCVQIQGAPAFYGFCQTQ